MIHWIFPALLFYGCTAGAAVLLWIRCLQLLDKGMARLDRWADQPDEPK